MAKKTNQKFSTKNIVILTALALALVGYFGYRSLLTSPDINLIGSGEGGTLKTPKKTIFTLEIKNGKPLIKRYDIEPGAIITTTNPNSPSIIEKQAVTGDAQTKVEKLDEKEQNDKDKVERTGRGPNTGETGRYDTK